MYFVIRTFGCKVNQYESDSISASMQASGFNNSSDPDGLTKTDVLIINSCTVTENSDKKVKQLIKNARIKNSGIVIALIGCFPAAFPDSAKTLGADIILGTADKPKLPQIIKNYFNNKDLSACNDFEYGYEEFSDGQASYSNNTRAYIKIEDGCERFCSYCIIPKARGKVRSRMLPEIRKEAENLAEAGHKELVLVGINLSCYGQDLGLTLIDAAEAASEDSRIARIRLSSLEPDFLNEHIIKRLSAIEKLCPHFHLSLQSGCDSTLLRMNRHYTTADYSRIVESLRKNFPNCTITTDIMVGFAGETDAEFEETLKFVNDTQFSKIHIFTYSKRAGTTAAERTDHVPEKVKAERYDKMSVAARELENSFFNSQIGTVQQILTEKRTHSEFVYGHTANYLPVRVYGENFTRHELANVRITEVNEKYCIGMKE